MENITLFISSIPFFLFLLYYIYFKLSQFSQTITIKQKYKTTHNGFDSHIIHDTQNNKYICDTCIWKLHFNNVKLWESLKENKKYIISGYGFNVESLFLNKHVFSMKIIE